MALRSGDREPDAGSTLRGPAPVSASPRMGRIIGALVVGALAAVLVISFVSAQSDNARMQRLKSAGIPLIATIQGCVGNLGGSGSNASSYTCRATYHVGSASYLEVVGRQNNYVVPGTRVRVIADPRQHSTIVLASSLVLVSVSARTYLVPTVMSVLFIALLAGYFYRKRQ